MNKESDPEAINALEKIESLLESLSEAGVDLDDDEELAKHGITFLPACAVSCSNKECKNNNCMWGMPYEDIEDKEVPPYHKPFTKTPCPFCNQMTLYKQ